MQSLVPSQLVLVQDRVQLARQELSPQAGHQRLEELVPNQQEEQRKLEEQAQLQSLELNQQEQEVLVQAQ